MTLDLKLEGLPLVTVSFFLPYFAIVRSNVFFPFKIDIPKSDIQIELLLVPSMVVFNPGNPLIQVPRSLNVHC